MKLSTVADLVPASPIRKLVPYAQKAKDKGIKVYHLNIGDPDIKTPEVMMSVLRNWQVNPIGYSQSKGEPVLLRSLLKYYQGLGFKQLTNEQLQITFGGSEGILWALLSTCNPGDEIIVFDPTYANYISLATMARVKVVPVITHIKDGFHLPSREIIESVITNKTKGFLFSNPSNPTGVVYSRSEIDMLIDIARKNHLYIFSDEVYREFVYDQSVKAISALEYLETYPEGIVVLDSLSKRYSLCGARVGAVVSKNKAFMDSLLKYAQARLSTGIVDQNMAAELINIPEDYFQNIINEYKLRRDTLIDGISKIKGVVCYRPEGAFYVIAKLPVKNAENFATWLLSDFADNNETAMLAPANGFYASPNMGIDEVRIAYVLNVESLVRCVEIIDKALKIYVDN